MKILELKTVNDRKNPPTKKEMFDYLNLWHQTLHEITFQQGQLTR